MGGGGLLLWRPSLLRRPKEKKKLLRGKLRVEKLGDDGCG